MQRITSRDGSSSASAGFKVFGSERKAITSLPPACPGAPPAIMRSSPACNPRPCAAEQAHEIAAIRTSDARNSPLLPMYQLLAEIYLFLQRHRFVKFLQCIGGGVKYDQDGDQEQRRQKHPPIRRKHRVLLQRR